MLFYEEAEKRVTEDSRSITDSEFEWVNLRPETVIDRITVSDLNGSKRVCIYYIKAFLFRIFEKGA